MSLRNQPYLPLYVQDFMTDEKLNECSATANGVYIRLMCLMHKSEEYGIILLKQKHKQSDKQILNFAYQLAKNMPFSIEEITSGLTELISEKVLILDEDRLIQKRMVKDNSISEKRASAGSKGGKKSILLKQNKEICLSKSLSKIEANIQANSENEIEVESETENDNSTNSEEEKIQKKEVLENYDPYDYAGNEKYFEVYKKECPKLMELHYERRDGKTLIALAEFRSVIKDDLEYFTKVCKKANEQVVIANNKIDFRSILNNHIGIFGDKYKKNEQQNNSVPGESSFEKLARELDEEGY